SMTTSYHRPVLLNEMISFLKVKEGAWYIDGTLGGGGYSAEILRHGGHVMGIDRDISALEYTRERFHQEFPDRQEGKEYILVHENYRNVEEIVRSLGVRDIQGVVLDLGVSSFQLDTETRGFSYRFLSAPIDMRMNQQEGLPASSILNTNTKEELYDIFAKYGEEERARAIADAIVFTRRVKRFECVGDVVSVIQSIHGDTDRILARVFQALRIVVNDELRSLQDGLEGSSRILPKGGRLVVVSFHSLEDRMVKRFLTGSEWKAISDVIRPSKEEVRSNSRAKRAKLRAGEKL
ncbi:MAG: 16S rRNA (cytosine(1402)-N(4))-methyltransferase RsmH, partial [Patescibacteria group bacterium]|nr:16S rRNA (cytosine(1402)-N(4))-methyltransferase RsmH [Patescibacteria group bacterium]